jgi:hypothetical protein
MIKGMFEKVIVVAVQSDFHLEMHQNNIYFYFLKLFLTSAHRNDLKT